MTGGGRAPAEIGFHPTLTFITGASNTGKSHIFKCVNFGLGAPTPEHDFPEARGYDEVLLELASNGEIVTVRRTFGQEDVALWFAGPMEDWDDEAAEELPVQADRARPLATLGGRLMNAMGFDPSMALVKNQRGETQVLSFRTISNLFLVSEEEVISDKSLVVPSPAFAPTANRSAFSLMVSGRAPSDEQIAQLREAHLQRQRATQQVEVLVPMIEDLRAEIAEAGDRRDHLEREIAQIDEQLGELSEAVAASGDAVREQLTRRNEALAAAERARKRVTRSSELQSRFKLLAEHYASDVQRLEFAMESGHFFQQLAASHCPRCGRTLTDEDQCHPELADFAAIERASRVEIKKLAPKIAELRITIADVERETAEAGGDRRHWQKHAAAIDREIQLVANPTAAKARARVQGLAKRRRQLEERLLRFRELDRYLTMKQEADLARRQAIETFRPRQDATSLRSLQEHVRRTLNAWHLPVASDVVYDIRDDDLVVDGKARAANGKGVRAVMHAAFTVGLMRHCFDKNTPHAGFVVIDSPLTPFRGSASDDEEDPQERADVHSASLHSLASVVGAGQTVIIDNIDPPTDLDDGAEVVVFTGPGARGRHGFYPTS